MDLSNIMKKLDKYQARLADGKAEKIKPRHIQKVMEKLCTKEEQLLIGLQEASKPEKRKRLEDKISTVRVQIDRARWLEKNL